MSKPMIFGLSILFKIEEKTSELSKKKEVIERNLKKEKKKIEVIREAVILNESISCNVSVIREKLLRIMSQLKRKDITIDKKERLEIKEAELQEELRQKCNHPFVFHRDGYSGSSLDDYENGYPSERYCIVCGLEEKAKNFRQNGRLGCNVGNVFEALKTSEIRVIHSEPYRPHPECFSKLDIWVPLGVALKPFEEEVARVLNS